ncbi:TPA: glycosyltransferase [Photobacterium damselae]
MSEVKTGASQVSISNLKLLEKANRNNNIETVCLSSLNYNNPYVIKFLIFMRSIFGYSSCLGFFSGHKFINSELLKKSDIIWCDGSLYGPLLKKIKKRYPQKKLITFFHNVETDFYKEIYPKGNILYSFFIKSSRINEKKSAIYSSELIVLTNQDKCRVEKLFNVNVNYVIPVLFDDTINHIEIKKSSSNSVCRLLFVGSDFPPNVEAIKFLHSEVMPYVNDKVFLTIIGNGMEKYRDLIESKNIKVYGFVQDLSNFYANSDVVLSPIFSGAGMKVKIAEAFRYGKGVIGTEFGFNGYDLSKKFIHIADDKERFIYCINKYKENVKYSSNDIISYYNDNFTIDSQLKKINGILSL